MDIRNIHTSKTVRGIIIGLGIAVLALVIFQIGMVAGYHKARFGARFGDNFERNFVDPRREGMVVRFFDGGMPGGHGAVGEIVGKALPQVIVAGPDNLEKTVLVGTTTKIREFQNEVTADKLHVGNFIVVLGTPNNEGQINAKLIRLMPSPPGWPINDRPAQ